jgi:exopolysaccharide biosynthesis polyprenyl glycosylphosphotransferase
VVSERLLGSLEQLEQILMSTVVDEVLIALPVKSHYSEIQRAIEECERAGVESRYSADVFPSRLARARVESLDGEPAVSRKVVSDDYRLVVKRMIDILGAGLGLLVLAPAMALIAFAVVTTSRGPAVFGQERYGWRKRRFVMYKFRTMVTNAEELQAALESRNEAVGPVFKIANDPRVTPLGRFLRKTSLDELPQLWNVLRGDMSLIGPRPLPMRDVNRFSDAWLMRRFSVLPGLTGLWQVSGRSNLTFGEWVQLDLQYIDRWSLALDFNILLRTIPAVLRGTGAK